MVLANVWTEVVWYKQLGYFSVWRTQWVARVVIFAIVADRSGVRRVGLVALGQVGSARAFTAPGHTPLDQYREQIRPIERVVTDGAARPGGPHRGRRRWRREWDAGACVPAPHVLRV